MTLDEAIKYYKGMSNFYKSEFHKEGAEKCSQLAEWLEELKDYRAEFIEARQKDYETDYAKGREDEREKIEQMLSELPTVNGYIDSAWLWNKFEQLKGEK